jgi:hypothetical protein
MRDIPVPLNKDYYPLKLYDQVRSGVEKPRLSGHKTLRKNLNQQLRIQSERQRVLYDNPLLNLVNLRVESKKCRLFKYEVSFFISPRYISDYQFFEQLWDRKDYEREVDGHLFRKGQDRIFANQNHYG